MLSHSGFWYGNVEYAVDYARNRSGSKPATVPVLDAAGAVVETIEHNPNVREGAGIVAGI